MNQIENTHRKGQIMGRTRVTAILLGLPAIAIVTPEALAVYHPTAARSLQRDPIGYVDGMSLYEYVGGNPVRFADPWGRQPSAPYDLVYYQDDDHQTDLELIRKARERFDEKPSPRSAGPTDMLSAYIFWAAPDKDRHMVFDEQSRLVKAVRASRTYAIYKFVYMEQEAKVASLRWSQEMGNVEKCEIRPTVDDVWLARHGHVIPAGTEWTVPRWFAPHVREAWWWQRHIAAFTGYYLGGMLGRCYIEMVMTCVFCQRCHNGKFMIDGGCAAFVSIDDDWEIGAAKESTPVERAAGGIGRPIHMHLRWYETFTWQTSRKP
jgi:hypothetical protein